MPNYLYAVTAVKENQPVGSFLIASNPDEAAAKATAVLGNGTLSHIVPFCEARLSTMQRNKLLDKCPKNDQIAFLAGTVLEIVESQLVLVQELREKVSKLQEIIEARCLIRFLFTVVERTGAVQRHSVYSSDLETAEAEAKRIALSEYGEGSKVFAVREASKEAA
ncbi:hypothetical protein [Roseimaritima ulvae]|uniref:Uncharacterized protein n=1 Tax=Roseimaritima ulvae TaxID=980254 RepID=A0A5B9QSI0_9BACT|nr:hypothetical protein [Roseimaritima ulvae]QEG42077.1 hypothetical protein UC8_41070 [Roseimaritima ulvae]